METAAGLGLPSPHLDYSRPAAEMILSPGNNSDRVVEQARQPPVTKKREKNSSSSTQVGGRTGLIHLFRPSVH
jgi:hypothetical protein